MTTKKEKIVAIVVYAIVVGIYIIGLSFPDGNTLLGNLLLDKGISPYVTSYHLYLPSLMVISITILAFLFLKWFFRNKVTLWINGLVFVAIIVIIFWKIVIL